jgi:hypothetical protein
MTTAGTGAGDAPDATVEASSSAELADRLAHDHAVAVADAADAAAEKIKAQVKGMQETLKAKQAEAKEFRALADKRGGEG